MAGEERNIDDPTLLAEQARENIEKTAADVRAQTVPIEMEPPTVFTPEQ